MALEEAPYCPNPPYLLSSPSAEQEIQRYSSDCHGELDDLCHRLRHLQDVEPLFEALHGKFDKDGIAEDVEAALEDGVEADAVAVALRFGLAELLNTTAIHLHPILPFLAFADALLIVGGRSHKSSVRAYCCFRTALRGLLGIAYLYVHQF